VAEAILVIWAVLYQLKAFKKILKEPWDRFIKSKKKD